MQRKDRSAAIIAAAMLMIAQGASGAAVTKTMTLKNPLNKNRTDCPVVVDLKTAAPGLHVVRAVVNDGDKEIPCQLDDLDRDGVNDELALVIDMGARQNKKLRLTLSDEGEQPQYPARVWADFMLRSQKKGEYARITEVTVPGDVNFYNMVYGHGPMFESELVGYRVYFNEKQTLDPYGKFNKRLELIDTKFYPTDRHLADGYGDDVLLAGNSCGVGALKGWDGSKATHVKPVKTRTERLVAAGPVRTIVEVEVDDWDYNGTPIDMLNRYTLYAGHRDLQIDAEFGRPLVDETFATGVERIMGDETVSYTDRRGLVASWGRHWPVTDTVKYAKETIGIATYVPEKYIRQYVEDADNYLYTISAPGSNSLRYYTMFTSRKETFGYPDSATWFAYLPKWREEIDHPVAVTIE